VIGMGGEEARSVAVGGRVLLMRPPDILIFMQMAHHVATCMHYTGLDPFTREEVYVARHLRDGKLQRGDAVLQAREPLPGA
jgi:hypothetical protein